MPVDSSPASDTEQRYPRPMVGVDPDKSLWWLGRIWPIVMVQKRPFLASIGAGMVGIAAQVAGPGHARGRH